LKKKKCLLKELNKEWVPPTCGTSRITEDFESTNEFIGCVFENINSGDVDGGAIYFSSSGVSSFSFDFCEFINISITNASDNYYGGSICIYYVDRVRVESSTFENTTGGSGGTIFIYSTSKSLLIHNCSLLNSSSRNYGQIFINSYTITDLSSSSIHSIFGTIFGCLFFDCSSSTSYAHGGGLCISYPPEKGSIRSCVFHLCRNPPSYGYGGGILFSSLPSSMSDEKIVSFFFFWKGIVC
jgi:hypothetical protein